MPSYPTFSATKTGQRQSNSPAAQLEHFLFDAAREEQKRQVRPNLGSKLLNSPIPSESTLLYRANWSDSERPSKTGSIEVQSPCQEAETVTVNQTLIEPVTVNQTLIEPVTVKKSFSQKLRNLLSPKGFALFKKEMPVAPGFGCENAQTQLPKNLKRQQTKHAAHFSATKKWSKILQKVRLSKKHNACYVERDSVCVAEDADQCPVRTQKVHRFSALRSLCKLRGFRIRVGCKPENKELTNSNPSEELCEKSCEELATAELTASARDYHTEKHQLSEYRTKLSRELDSLTTGKTPDTDHEDPLVAPPLEAPIPKVPIFAANLISAESTLYSKTINSISDHGDKVIASIDAAIDEILENQPGKSLTARHEICSLVDQATMTSLFSIETIAPLQIAKNSVPETLNNWLLKPKSQLWKSLGLQDILPSQLNKNFELQCLVVDLNFLCKTKTETKLNGYLSYLKSVLNVERHEEAMRLEKVKELGAIGSDFTGSSPATVTSTINQLLSLQVSVFAQDTLMNHCKKKIVAQFEIHDYIEAFLSWFLKFLQATGEKFVNVCTDMANKDLVNKDLASLLADYKHQLGGLMDNLKAMEKIDRDVKFSIAKIKAGSTRNLTDMIQCHSNAFTSKKNYYKQLDDVWVQSLGRSPLTQKEMEMVIGCTSLEYQRDFSDECLHFKAKQVMKHQLDRIQTLHKTVSRARNNLLMTFGDVRSRFMTLYDFQSTRSTIMDTKM